jgi:tRNA(fMet)-specific endonuclease VapC
MRYLVDSDKVAAYLKGRTDTTSLLNSLIPDGLAISLVTYGEIYEGIYRGTNSRAHERSFQAFLRLVIVLPLNRRIMKRFAQLRGDLRSRGELLPDMDLLIAATALTHDLTLVTGNSKHFQRVPGLAIL